MDPIPPARTVRDNMPPTPARCPTCDREGCDQRMVAAVGGPVRDCDAKHRVDWRARALAAKADAARWRKVAPLIEALRAAWTTTDKTETNTKIAALLAATQEPTP